MPWEENHNLRSLSPHGLKDAQGFAAPAVHDPRCVVCGPVPPGILGPEPLGATKSSPYMPQPAPQR
jgi:hypothetical protein